jgi:hypothetical protein
MTKAGEKTPLAPKLQGPAPEDTGVKNRCRQEPVD